MNEKIICFENQNINKLESNSKCNKYSNKKRDLELKKSKSEEKSFF